MSRKFEKMAIPVEADGIVDDEEEFQNQIAANEEKLAKEIAAVEDNPEALQIDDFQDMEFVPYSEATANMESIKLIKRQSILGKKALKFSFFGR